MASDHVAFVRAGGLESGHLLPVPRTREALDVLVDNVRAAQAMLGVPLALENIAPLLAWPDAEMSEGAFLAELCERTGAWLLLDVANLHASAVNLGQDPARVLDELPLERVVYVHAAGGVERDGVYHDTHAHALTAAGARPARRSCARATGRRRCCSSATTATRPTTSWRQSWRRCAAVHDAGAGVSREELAARQAALLAALVAAGPAPAGIDPARVALEAAALRAKRRRVLARLVPVEVHERLGAELAPRLDAWIAAHPRRTGTSMHADADAFVAHLRTEGLLGRGRRRGWASRMQARRPRLHLNARKSTSIMSRT